MEIFWQLVRYVLAGVGGAGVGAGGRMTGFAGGRTMGAGVEVAEAG